MRSIIDRMAEGFRKGGRKGKKRQLSLLEKAFGNNNCAAAQAPERPKGVIGGKLHA